jgi:hypothetical protein
MKMLFILANICHPAFVDVPPVDKPPVDAPPEEKPPVDEDTPPLPNGKKTFTQDDVNRLLADDKRKHQEQVKKAISEVEALKSKSRLTQEEREDLDKRIAQMQNELLTKEELAKKERERLLKKHDDVVSSLAKERDNWKDRYVNSAIKRSITDAAATNDAYNPQQIVALLQSDTRLVEKLDDSGKPTGEFVPKIRFSDTDKEGKPVALDLDPTEAVKRMKELEHYQNLFKGTGVGGIGANNQPSGKKLDAKKLASDPAAYRQARKDGKLKF